MPAVTETRGSNWAASALRRTLRTADYRFVICKYCGPMNKAEPAGDYYLYLRTSLEAATRSFDKTTVTLAAGALVLSVTFLKDVAASTAEAKGWLLAGWIGLVLSLTFNSFSYLSSERTFSHALHHRMRRAEFWNRATSSLNLLSGVGLASGLFFLSLFAYQNI